MSNSKSLFCRWCESNDISYDRFDIEEWYDKIEEIILETKGGIK